MAAAATATAAVLLVVLLLPVTSLSQGNAPPEASVSHRQRFNGPMGVLIAVLITAFFFMGFFSIYLRQCGGGERSQHGGPSMGMLSTALSRNRSRRQRGLDEAVIASFPTFLYSDVKQHKLGSHGLECAVCLLDFEDDDTLRLLPHCSHAFHPDCVDMWLSSHTTCPVCRHNLTLPPPAAEEEPPADPPPPPPPPQDEVRVSVEQPIYREPEGSRGFKVPKLWRSRTTARVHWGEEEMERRFTLRLPDHLRREVMACQLRRSATVAVGEGRERRTLRGEGSSRGGRSFNLRRAFSGQSDRWTFLSGSLSLKFKSGDGEGNGAEGRDAAGKGKSVTGAASSVLSPRDCFGASAKKDGGEEDDGLMSRV